MAGKDVKFNADLVKKPTGAGRNPIETLATAVSAGKKKGMDAVKKRKAAAARDKKAKEDAALKLTIRNADADVKTAEATSTAFGRTAGAGLGRVLETKGKSDVKTAATRKTDSSKRKTDKAASENKVAVIKATTDNINARTRLAKVKATTPVKKPSAPKPPALPKPRLPRKP